MSKLVSQSYKPTELEELCPESAVPLNFMKLAAHCLDVLLQIWYPRTDLIALFSAAEGRKNSENLAYRSTYRHGLLVDRVERFPSSVGCDQKRSQKDLTNLLLIRLTCKLKR